MRLFSQCLPKPSVPLWFCLCALKQRSHLTSSPTHVLMTHQCNFRNCYDSERKSHVEPFRNNSRFYEEIWTNSLKKHYHHKNRAVSRKWAKKRVLDKSHLCHTPWHIRTLIAQNRDSLHTVHTHNFNGCAFPLAIGTCASSRGSPIQLLVQYVKSCQVVIPLLPPSLYLAKHPQHLSLFLTHHHFSYQCPPGRSPLCVTVWLYTKVTYILVA